MKKALLSLALMLLCGIGMAQTKATLSFDFEDNAIPDCFINNKATNTGATTKFWTVVSGGANSSGYCIKSGNNNTHSSTNTITTTLEFTSAGTVSFDANCQGEGTSTIYDKCIFSIDGTEQFRHGADVSGWQHYNYNVSSGTHTFSWSYQKDGSTHPTGDCFMVDNVVFTNAVRPSTIYLNLRKANITLNSSNQLVAGCYKWDHISSTWYVTSTAESIDFGSVYEIGMWADAANPLTTVIEPVTTTNGGTVNIVNRSESGLTAITEWESRANNATYSPVRRTYKGANNFAIQHTNGELKVRLNNVWCTGVDDFIFTPTTNNSNTKLHILLKGDNRLLRIGVNNASSSYNNTELIIESDPNFAGTGTLTAGGAVGNNASVIGSNTKQDSNTIKILSGVIYAGSSNYACAIGAGRQGNCDITITGANTIVTGVTKNIGSAIGAGGTNDERTMGCGGTVNITNGASVYAYNYGYRSGNSTDGYTYYRGSTAIGGGGSGKGGCTDMTINIEGTADHRSTIVAYSYYGPAIGAGTTRADANATGYDYRPGDLTLNIAYADVIAQTVDTTDVTGTTDPDDASGYMKFSAARYCSISGGRATSSSNTHNGGSLNFTMSNSTLSTGSVGSGTSANTSYYAGQTNISISNNCTFSGQFVIRPTDSSHPCTFSMNGGSITNRDITNHKFTQWRGGALHIRNSYTTASLTNVTVKSTSGHARYYTGGSDPTRICYTGEGGAIYAYCPSSSGTTSLTLSGCTFNECSTGRNYETVNNYVNYYGEGGAVYQYRGTLSIANCDFDECDTYSASGSGMYLYYTNIGNSNVMNNCNFTDCTGGHALYLSYINNNSSTVSLTNCDISGCTGGYGLYTTYTRATLDNACSITSCNGGLRAYTGSYVTLNGCPISNCNGASTGGAIYAYGTASSSSYTTLNLNNVNITNCSSTGNGGAIYFTGAWSDLYMNGGKIENCHSTGTSTSNSGGALYLTCSNANYPSTYNFYNNALIKNCYSGGQGGAIYMTGTGNLTMDDCSIEDCYTTTTSNGNGKGGAIFVDGTSGSSKDFSITLNNTTISGCHTHSKGGAIYKEGYNGDISLNGVTITDCHVTSTSTTYSDYNGGGGIYLLQGGAINLNSGTVISECTAPSGGGIYVYKNTSSTAANRGTINMTPGASIVDCEATGSVTANGYGYGGGVYFDHYSYNSATLSGSITGCSAVNGGGVAIYSYSNYTYPGQIILDGNINDCTASNLGGGVYIDEKGKLYLTGGDITDNTATTNGGGIYKLGTLMVSGSPTVKGNSVSTRANNVYIPTTAPDDFIYVDNVVNPDGIDCGASIGVSKLSSEHTYVNGDYTNITAVSNSSSTSTNNVPIYATKANCFQKCEFIIPASALTGLVGQTITKITFYTSGTYSDIAKIGGNSAKFTGFMTTTDDRTTSTFDFVSGTNVVYAANSLALSNNKIEITLSTSFSFSDGAKSIRFGLWQTAKGSAVANGINFEGYTVPGACVSSETTSTSTTLANVVPVQRNFLPRMTITTSSGKVWEYPNEDILVDNTPSALRNRVFFDDTKTCGVYNSPNAPTYYDGNSNVLYFVKHTTTNNDFYLDAAAAVAGTDYTISNDYVTSVLTERGLAYLSTDVEGGKDYAGKTVTLENDLNLSSYQWEPIGYSSECGASSSAFAGIFDGKGHHINGLTCQYDYPSLGLFGCVSGTVKNLYLMSGTLGGASNNAYMGGIVGNLAGGSVINCESAVTMTGGPTAIMGGIVGKTPQMPEYETAGDESANNEYVPTYGQYAETYQKCEYIIPAANLASLNGKDLSGIRYYLQSPASGSWGAARYQVFLKEVSGTTLSAFDGTTGATIVYTGPLDASQSTMDIGFTTTYHYNGGNLLVGIYEIEPGTYKAATFYGTAATGACVQGNSSSSLAAVSATQRNFIPKTTFSTVSDIAEGGSTWDMVNAQTIHNGTVTNEYVPVYGYWADAYNKCEYIIPAADLAGRAGDYLSGLTYYVSSHATGSWGNAYFRVFVKEVSSTTLSNFQGMDGATIVYEGPLDGTQDQMNINFATSYLYNGGNLLVGIYETVKGTYKQVSFYGETVSGACVSGYNSESLDAITATQRNFIPKTTLTWTALALANINSCTAMPTMTGRSMGGIVGRLSTGGVVNSFANPNFTYNGSTEYVGGIAGTSQGNVVNCYTRQRSSLSSHYGWIVGDNGGTVSECYIPSGNSNIVGTGNAAVNSGTYAPTETPYLFKHNDTRLTINGTLGSERLLTRLNDWATAHESTPWLRTSASPINTDYPVLKYPDSKCVYSPDNLVLNYSSDFNAVLGALTTGAVFLYGNAGSSSNPITNPNNGNVSVYIDEDATLYHTSTITNAYVGITLKDAAWHMFSPAISNAPLGINYAGDNTSYPFSTSMPSEMPYYQFYPESTQDGYFPSHVYSTTYTVNNSVPDGCNYYYDWDYYCYYEPQYHWINFKRNGNSHHHEDGAQHEGIAYQYYNGSGYTVGNEPFLIKGKGYLLGTRYEAMLQSKGTLNQGTVTIPLTTEGPVRTGYNFIGNPYQSYLDFNAFASDSENSFIWGGTANACYIMLYGGAYHVYNYNASANQLAAPRLIHPHQGFMVISRLAGNAKFKNAHRVVHDDANAPFRDLDQPTYTLVNLVVTDDEEKMDIVTVELDRTDEGGAYKSYDMHYGKASIYAHYDDRDWAVAFTQPGTDVVPIRFETIEDGTFTITWDIENGTIPYVHLIDNLTGIDIDCLTDTAYRFTATTNDYKSRFKLVFQFTGIDEYEDDDDTSTGAVNFAFQMGDEWVVNGEGTLQLFDVNGHLLGSYNVVGQQSTIRLPDLSAGVYLLRLTNSQGTLTQKIVIKH